MYLITLEYIVDLSTFLLKQSHKIYYVKLHKILDKLSFNVLCLYVINLFIINPNKKVKVFERKFCSMNIFYKLLSQLYPFRVKNKKGK